MERTNHPSPSPSVDLESLDKEIRLESVETLREAIETLCQLQAYCNDYQDKLSRADIDHITGLDDATIIDLTSRLVTIRYRLG